MSEKLGVQEIGRQLYIVWLLTQPSMITVYMVTGRFFLFPLSKLCETLAIIYTGSGVGTIFLQGEQKISYHTHHQQQQHCYCYLNIIIYFLRVLLQGLLYSGATMTSMHQ